MNPEDTIGKKDKKAALAKTDKEPVKKIDANKMLRFYRLAQDAYSKKTYDISLAYIDSSMFYGESSDALGLKGSVYFTKGEVELAKRVWEQAKVIDKDFKVPVINQKYIRK
jgi:predicted negative regulator of RcsB-dependent stress response